MKHVLLPRDEEAIREERKNWWIRYGWGTVCHMYHPENHRPRHMSIPEDNDLHGEREETKCL